MSSMEGAGDGGDVRESASPCVPGSSGVRLLNRSGHSGSVAGISGRTGGSATTTSFVKEALRVSDLVYHRVSRIYK